MMVPCRLLASNTRHVCIQETVFVRIRQLPSAARLLHSGSSSSSSSSSSSTAYPTRCWPRNAHRHQPSVSSSAGATAVAAAAVAAAGAASGSNSLVNGPLSSWAAANGAAREPPVAFIFEGLDQLLPLVLGGWLAVTLVSTLADKARRWCDAHPDEPLAVEVISLLPEALEGPSRFAVTTLVATRLLRSLAGLLHEYVERFSPTWNSPVDALVGGIIAALGPLDQALLSLYAVLAIAVTTRVLTKWKSIAFELILKHERAREQVLIDTWEPTEGSYTKASGSAGSLQLAYGSDNGVERSAGSAGAAGVMLREGAGSMLCVEMRPRLPTAAAAAATLDEGSDADGSEASEAAGPERRGFAGGGVAAEGARGPGAGSSRSSRRPHGKWFVGKSADDLERLLLPLDGVLSWILVVVAGLLTAQTLGINIQPLLAVGGASSIIIGLATQTLLSNAVTGMSIFLSRPFVAGDSVTVQGIGNIIISGTVERITPLRTLMRTDDDVLVTVPNKTVSDMVIYNRSRRDARRRFKLRNSKERQLMKFKVKQPHKELHQLEALQEALRRELRRPGVAQQSVELGLSRFTDAGAELLVRFLLLVAPGSPEGQRLLMDMSLTVRQYGATLVSIM